MGCGQSKGDPEKEPVTSKLTPLLRRRFEEIKRRKNNNNADSNGALSKQELLKHINHEDDHDPSLSNSQSVDENDHIEGEASRKESVRPSSASYLKDEDKLEKKAESDGNESEAAKGRLNDVDFSYLLYPSSPSFRVYCVDQPVDNANDETNYRNDDECDQKHQDDDSCETVASSDSNELPHDSVTPTKGKGKKGERFMKVMGKGKPGRAVKNLLNVTACYQHSKAGSHNPQLLPQQAV